MNAALSKILRFLGLRRSESVQHGQDWRDPIGPLSVNLATDYHKKVDEFERKVVRQPQVVLPIFHHFAPGVYAREMRAPAGAWITSKIHLTEHFFVLSKGALSVLQENGEFTLICAPYTGITKPGTRRVAFVHDDIVWTTFHPTSETNPEEIEKQILLEHDEHLELSVSELEALKAIRRGDVPEELLVQLR